MLYRFKTKTDDKEYYEFNKYHSTASPDRRKSRLIARLEVPAIFLFVFIYYIIRGYDRYLLSVALIIFGLVSVIWFFSIKPLSLLFLKINIKFMKKNGKLPYSNYAVLEFYDDYFLEITQNTKSEIKYDAILKVRINEPKAIYIYQNSIQAFIIPFNSFASCEEREEFIDFIKKKLKNNY